MARAVIYLVENKVTGDTYIGVTQYSVESRWRRHVYTAMTAPKTRLHKAIAEHGEMAFSISAVASCLSLESAVDVERAIIVDRRPTYNQTNGGQFTVGKRVSRDIVERIRAANTGKRRTPEQNAKNSEQARRRYQENPEYRAKILAALEKARLHYDRDKQRSAAREASRNRVWSDASRNKLSASCIGRRHDQEVINRIREKKRKKVECVTLNTVFDSVSEAAELTGLTISNVSKACVGKLKTARGMIFRFVS